MQLTSGAQVVLTEGNIHRNTPGCVGCSRCNLGCPSGEIFHRQRVAVESGAAGAQVLTGCMVTRITESQTGVRVEGNVLKIDGTEDNLEISCSTLVLSAGAIGTPSLLLDSGFGERNAEIGRGLHLQPVANTFGILRDPVSARGAAQGHYVDEFVGENILLESNPILAGAFFQSFPIFGRSAQELMKRSNILLVRGR